MKIDHNSMINQDIKGKLIAINVLANVNYMVEYILRKSIEDSSAPFGYDNIVNLYEKNCTECGESAQDFWMVSVSDLDEEIEEGYKCPKCEAILDKEPDSELKEVCEWWLVSHRLAEQLKAKGEVIIEGDNIWGRCCTGKAILLDCVISEIAEDMQILEGQAHSWAKE